MMKELKAFDFLQGKKSMTQNYVEHNIYYFYEKRKI